MNTPPQAQTLQARPPHRSSPAALLLAALVLSACDRPRAPAALPSALVAPVTIPWERAAAQDDESLLGYLRVRDPLALGRILVGDRLELLAQERGVPLTELRPGAGAALFVWDPAGQPLKAMPVAVVLPVPPGGALASRLARAAGDELVKGDAQGTLAALNPPGLLRATAAGAALWQVAASLEPGDLQLFVNLAAVMARFGPQARALLDSLEALAGDAPAGTPSPRAAVGMLQNLLDRLARLKAMSLTLLLQPAVLELATVVQDLPDQQGATGGPLAAPDLASLLPGAPGFDLRMQWNSRDLARWLREHGDLYGPLWAEQPALQAQVRALLSEWGRVVPNGQVALALGLRPAPRALLIARVPDPAAALFVLRRSIDALSAGPLHQLYLQQGMVVTVSTQLSARRIHGWPVDRYRFQVSAADPAQPLPAEARLLLDRFAGATNEVMRMGPYLLFSFNDSLEALAGAALMGPRAAAVPLVARQVYPAGGSSYGDVDLGGLWAGVRALLPPAAAARLPELPLALGMLTWFAYDGAGTSYYRVQLPRTLLGLLTQQAP